MMQLSVTLGFIANSVSPLPGETQEARLIRTARLLKGYGFSLFDYLVPCTAQWAEDAARFRDSLAREGVAVHQSHAPNFRHRTDLTRAEIQELYLRAVDATAAIGASYMVVHADEDRHTPGEVYDSEKAVRDQIELFLPVAERAARAGIRLACENVWQPKDEPRDRCSCTSEELLAILAGLNGTSAARPDNPAGCCWDFGHARMGFGADCGKELQKLLPHLLCTHVHDNRLKDDHQPPFTGKMDWPPLMQILREGGYRGNLSLELHYGRFPERVLPAYLAFVRAAGEELIRMAGGEER